jgi:regulatory protein
MGFVRSTRNSLTPEQAYAKIRHYCAFQERTHLEVKRKLSEYGLSWSDAGQVLSRLIEDGFLNEERFAQAFAGGKFRIKGWGKKKIEIELKKRGVAAYSILKALRDEIPVDAYRKKLQQLAEKKWSTLKGPGMTSRIRAEKTRQFLLRRGFENDLITKTLHEINGKTATDNDTD